MSTEIHKLNISEILGRVGKLINKTKNIDIAEELCVDPQVSSNWKTRKTIPWEILYEYAQKKNISIDWLLTGKEKTKSCTQPPGYDEFYNMLTEILSQSSDEQVKNALRTNLVAFKNSVDKDIKSAEKDKRIDNLEKKVDYLTEIYDRKIKSDT